MAKTRFNLLTDEINVLFKKYGITDFLFYIDLPKEEEDPGGLVFKAEGHKDKTAHAFLDAMNADPEFAEVVDNIAGHVLCNRLNSVQPKNDRPPN